MKYIFLILILVSSVLSYAQNMTSTKNKPAPIDGLVEPTTMAEKMALPYAPIREADILWEKKVWRIIDTREKINLPFRYPERPFYTILEEGIKKGKITAYSTESDRFDYPLDTTELFNMLYQKDTIPIIDVITGDITYQEIVNELNPEDIYRYRIKEIWYFDSKSSELKVRILGIAPMYVRQTESEDLKFETPMFWVYYPHCREYLAKEPVFTGNNDKQILSWEDWLEMRMFNGSIYKEQNMHDRALTEYLSGRDLLLESERIKMEIFNREQDAWSY